MLLHVRGRAIPPFGAVYSTRVGISRKQVKRSANTDYTTQSQPDAYARNLSFDVARTRIIARRREIPRRLRGSG